MPITQTRMTSLITAARDYKQALESLAAHIADLAAQRYSNPNSLELLEQIHLAAANHQSLMKYPRESHDTLLIEHTHFIRNSRRNAKNADDLRKRRANPNPNVYYVSPHEANIEAQYREAALSQHPATRATAYDKPIDIEPEIPPHILAAAAAFDTKDNRRREIERQAEDLYNQYIKDAVKNGVDFNEATTRALEAKLEFINEQTNDEGF